MAVVPTGNESLPLKALRELLSLSSAFRTWVGVANPTEALARIHYIGFDDPGSKTRPYAIVSFAIDAGWQLDKNAGGSVNNYGVGGLVVMELLMSVDTGQAIDEQVLTFANTTGAIITDMSKLSGSGALFDFSEVQRVEGPLLSWKDDKQDLPEGIDSLYAFRFTGSTTG